MPDAPTPLPPMMPPRPDAEERAASWPEWGGAAHAHRLLEILRGAA